MSEPKRLGAFVAREGRGLLETRAGKFRSAMEDFGAVTSLSVKTFKTLVSTPFDVHAVVYQIEQLGLKSMGIAAATAIFVAVVMTIQFAYALELFGAKDTLGRIIVLSEARELAPALTSLVVGSRVAAGMAAEIGSMNVTEQIDAIRSLGADPIRKLVIPRVVACIIVMPLIACIAFLLGMLSSMTVAYVSFGLSTSFFVSTALDAVTLQDIFSGLSKTPFFGFLIAILGCYFGMTTEGGTEGVGRSTTRSVVVVSITILIADALLTQIFVSL